MDLLEALDQADEAGLYYVSDASAGIRRRRSGKGWSYIGTDGAAIRDRAERTRIASIAIPPAWEEVWISPLAEGHIQATGRDAKGRKQYRYHPRWREVRDETKYHRMVAFGEHLPALRAQVEADLKGTGLPRRRVQAVVVRLLDQTLIRVGNEEYLENETYGLTTLQDDHVEVDGTSVHLEFRAKHGILQSVDLRDRRLARLIKETQDLPGQDLFQYLDADGQVVDIVSNDVNTYLAATTGQSFTAKDFRTWGGTVVVADSLAAIGPADTKRQVEKNILVAIDAAADKLGNTRTVARSSYVNPAILDAYRDGSLLVAFEEVGPPPEGLRAEEAAVLELLRSHPTDPDPEAEAAGEADAEAVVLVASEG